MNNSEVIGGASLNLHQWVEGTLIFTSAVVPAYV